MWRLSNYLELVACLSPQTYSNARMKDQPQRKGRAYLDPRIDSSKPEASCCSSWAGLSFPKCFFHWAWWSLINVAVEKYFSELPLSHSHLVSSLISGFLEFAHSFDILINRSLTYQEAQEVLLGSGGSNGPCLLVLALLHPFKELTWLQIGNWHQMPELKCSLGHNVPRGFYLKAHQFDMC